MMPSKWPHPFPIMSLESLISYLGRTDLAHVQASDLLPDSVGTQEQETIPTEETSSLPRMTSNGYARKLYVLHNGTSTEAITVKSNDNASQQPSASLNKPALRH